MSIDIPKSHPRAESLRWRERLIQACENDVVAFAGLIAHGRGEAFDYLLGEKTVPPAMKAAFTGAAALLSAQKPVISVNGNSATLTPKEIVELSEITGAEIEINLFYRSSKREIAIEKVLQEAGAKRILGVGANASKTLPELESARRRVDPRGILIADVVLVPLEDGDRTEALMKMDKRVIAIDLNPLSRTAQRASISIIDNVVRAMPLLIQYAKELRTKNRENLKEILRNYDNRKILAEAIAYINKRLTELSTQR